MRRRRRSAKGPDLAFGGLRARGQVHAATAGPRAWLLQAHAGGLNAACDHIDGPLCCRILAMPQRQGVAILSVKAQMVGLDKAIFLHVRPTLVGALAAGLNADREALAVGHQATTTGRPDGNSFKRRRGLGRRGRSRRV